MGSLDKYEIAAIVLLPIGLIIICVVTFAIFIYCLKKEQRRKRNALKKQVPTEVCVYPNPAVDVTQDQTFTKAPEETQASVMASKMVKNTAPSKVHVSRQPKPRLKDVEAAKSIDPPRKCAEMSKANL